MPGGGAPFLSFLEDVEDDDVYNSEDLAKTLISRVPLQTRTLVSSRTSSMGSGWTDTPLLEAQQYGGVQRSSAIRGYSAPSYTHTVNMVSGGVQAEYRSAKDVMSNLTVDNG